MQTRRGFVGLLAGLAAGAVLDPDRLLWVPGQKTISIPKLVVTPKEQEPGWVAVYSSYEDWLTRDPRVVGELTAVLSGGFEYRRWSNGSVAG